MIACWYVLRSCVVGLGDVRLVDLHYSGHWLMELISAIDGEGAAF